MAEPWRRVGTRQLADYRFFRLRQDTSRHPHNGREYDFFVFEFPHWVNIIPLTAEQEVVFVRQFRHGTRELSLEIPGGTIDPGESPKAAALRELAEETGYSATDAVDLGWVHPNPAIQENRCWSFLAQGVQPGRAQALEGSEAIDVELIPLSRVPGLFADGTISHALVVTAFHLYRQRLGRPLV